MAPANNPAMVEHTRETIQVDGCAIEVLRGGSGPGLLFLHGAGGASDWAPYMDRLAERFEIAVPSHPGFGRSDTPGWLDSMSDLAYFYLDAFEALGLDGVHVVGNSLGGWLACEIAVRSTGRMRSLTLVGAAGIPVDGVPMGDIFLWSPEDRVRNVYHDRSLAEARLARNPSEEEADIALKNYFTTSRLAWSPRFCNPDLPKWLHRIRIPTMILWGAEDRVFPPAYGEAYAASIPGSHLRIVPECGHLPHQEKTEAFIDAVAAIAEEAAP
ncbi:MAG: alpha/beta hydrolase [Defluviicoccus sp.]|nr:alpha/beta hydrolase [Defluviicoccus sp.]MDE0278243.1 alpha/beta hydrolase [Defluviicoccus sp.]